MEITALKSTLLDLLEQTRAAQQALLADLSDAERAATGTAEHWAAKDILTHITVWKERTAERLACAVRGAMPPDTHDFEALNARDFEQMHARTWADVAASEARVHGDLVAAIQQLSDADLIEPERYAWMNGNPLCLTILGNGITHPQEHLVKLALERGEPDRARHIQEDAAAAFARAALPDTVRGIALYNLACVCATTGQPDEALATLQQGLRLYPRLAASARADADLASLRDLPAFQALVAD